MNGDDILGVFYYAQEEDPTYATMYDGAWINENPYAVIHRIATIRGRKGVGSFCINWCLDQYANVRIDTHETNTAMINVLNKLGFTPCGKIIIDDGTERIGFQKQS